MIAIDQDDLVKPGQRLFANADGGTRSRCKQSSILSQLLLFRMYHPRLVSFCFWEDGGGFPLPMRARSMGDRCNWGCQSFSLEKATPELMLAFADVTSCCHCFLSTQFIVQVSLSINKNHVCGYLYCKQDRHGSKNWPAATRRWFCTTMGRTPFKLMSPGHKSDGM